nr:hypothetical protein [Candidatus Sigynarchaeota archaeon]
MVNVGILGDVGVGKTEFLRALVAKATDNKIFNQHNAIIVKADFSGSATLPSKDDDKETKTIHPNRVVFRIGDKMHTIFAPGGDDRPLVRMGITTVSRIARLIIALFDLSFDLDSQLEFYSAVRFIPKAVIVVLNRPEKVGMDWRDKIEEYIKRIISYFQDKRKIDVSGFFIVTETRIDGLDDDLAPLATFLFRDIVNEENPWSESRLFSGWWQSSQGKLVDAYLQEQNLAREKDIEKDLDLIDALLQQGEEVEAQEILKRVLIAVKGVKNNQNLNQRIEKITTQLHRIKIEQKLDEATVLILNARFKEAISVIKEATSLTAKIPSLFAEFNPRLKDMISDAYGRLLECEMEAAKISVDNNDLDKAMEIIDASKKMLDQIPDKNEEWNIKFDKIIFNARTKEIGKDLVAAKELLLKGNYMESVDLLSDVMDSLQDILGNPTSSAKNMDRLDFFDKKSGDQPDLQGDELIPGKNELSNVMFLVNEIKRLITSYQENRVDLLHKIDDIEDIAKMKEIEEFVKTVTASLKEGPSEQIITDLYSARDRLVKSRVKNNSLMIRIAKLLDIAKKGLIEHQIDLTNNAADAGNNEDTIKCLNAALILTKEISEGRDELVGKIKAQVIKIQQASVRKSINDAKLMVDRGQFDEVLNGIEKLMNKARQIVENHEILEKEIKDLESITKTRKIESIINEAREHVKANSFDRGQVLLSEAISFANAETNFPASQDLIARLNDLKKTFRKEKIKYVLNDIKKRIPRMQVPELAEESNETDGLIIETIKEMISSKEISAKYYESTRSIVFMQHIDETNVVSTNTNTA